MKTRIIALIAGLLAVLPMTSAWATSSSTYYAKLIVGISSKSPTGAGTVYAGSSAAAAQTSTTTSVDGSGSDTTVTLYAYAKANRGFKFANWVAAQDGSGTALSTDNPYACGIAASASKDDSSKRVPKTIYANFAVAPAVKVVFAAPDASNGDGYKYTADDGYDEYKVSDAVVGANGAEYNGFNSVKVTCTATHEKDEGKILGWWAKNENGEQIKVSQEESFTKLFTESMTVWPEFGKREKFVVTCKPAENGCYAVNDTVVSSEAQEVEGFDTLDAKLVAMPAKGYAFYKWYENDDDRINYFADVATVEKHTFNKKVEIGAMFTARKQVAVTFDESASEEKVTRTCGNAEIDFDETDNGFVGYDSAKVTLTAIAEKDKQVKWWYRINGGDKIYFSMGRTVTWTFTEDAVVGVDFFESDNSLSKLLAGVTAGATVTVEADADVSDGAEVTIPEGVTVSVSAGKTLFVDGKLTVLGTLTGEGTVSKCLKLLKQTGNGLEPCNPYGSVKYWKTAEAAANASIEGWSGTIATHLTVLRGDGVAVRGAISSTTKMVQCTFDTTKAVNHVTSIVAAFDAAEIVASNPYIFLADGEIKGPTRTDTSSGKTYTRISYSSTVDCAGHNCSLTKNALASQVSSNNRGVHLNAPVVNFSPKEYWQQGWATFYNCPNVTMNSLKGEGNKIFLYDSGETMSFTQNSSGHAAPQFYSGKTTYDFSSSVLNDTTAIFGGAFKVKPADKRISSELSGSMEFHQHEDDDYWYLEPKTDQNVATIDGTGYETLDAAFKYLEEQASATLTLARDVMVPEVLTLPAGKKLTIELNGCKIEAPNGFIRNYGDLAIRDNANRMDVCGIYVGPEKCILENFDGAAADVCYGVYQGDFLVNGGTLTTHYGRFTGNVTKRGGEVHLKGGIFSKDVSALMDEGYLAFNYGNACYVGRFPRPYLTAAEIRDTDFAYELLAMSPADRDLYINMKSCALGDGIDEEDWKYVAELKSAYTFLGDNFLIDVLVKFDRPVVAGSAKVTVMSGGISFTEPVPEVAANEFRRELSPRITQTQVAYKYFIDDPDDKYDDLTAGFSDVKGANQGTTIFLAMELWKYHERKKFDKMDSYLTIIEKPTVFGAGANVAMLQAAEGPTPAENFFVTLQEAVNASATTEKTIKLCNDCGEDVTIAKSCTVDLNGFGFTGSFVKGEGVEETVEGDVHTFVVSTPARPPVVAKIGEKEYASLAAAVRAAKGMLGPVVISLEADCNETVIIPDGVTIRLNGKTCPNLNVPSGYTRVDGDGTVSVEITYVAVVGGTSFKSFDEAISTVAEGGTVKVVKNCSSSVPVAKECVINAGAFTVDGLAADEAKGYRLDSENGFHTISHPNVANALGEEFTSLSDAIAAVAEIQKDEQNPEPVEIVLEKNCAEVVAVDKVCCFTLKTGAASAFSGSIVAGNGLAISRGGMTWTVVKAQTVAMTNEENTAVKVSAEFIAAVTSNLEAGETVEDRVTDEIKAALADTDVEKRDGLAKVTTENGCKVIGSELEGTDLANEGTGVYQATKSVDLEIETAEGVKVVETVTVLDMSVKPDAVIRADSKSSSLILAVPGDTVKVEGKAEAQPVTVANVFATTPASGDSVVFFTDAGDTYCWIWRKGDDGKMGWQHNGDGTPDAETPNVISAGSALRYQRAEGSVAPVAVKAELDEIREIKTEIKEDGWNVVANPNAEGEFDLNEGIRPGTGVTADDLVKDRIVVPLEAAEGVAQREYTFKDGAWGYDATEKTKWGLRRTRTTDAKVGAGKGFWYVSGGKRKPTIPWRAGKGDGE